MRKIPTLFVRDENDRRYVTNAVTPGCEWVLAGKGVATRKYDGTSCLVKNGELYKRYEARYQLPLAVEGGDVKLLKPLPEGFLAADWIDANTGKQPGWVPVGDGPDDKYHREAWLSWKLTAEVELAVSFPPPDGTYELIGPKVQSNPEGYSAHVLISHLTETAFDSDVGEIPRDFNGLRNWLSLHDYEGIVWHWPQADGSILMVKLKRRDFKYRGKS